MTISRTYAESASRDPSDLRSGHARHTWTGLVATATAAFYSTVFYLLLKSKQVNVQLYFGGWGTDQILGAAALLIVAGVLVAAGCFVPPLVTRISQRIIKEIVEVVLAGTYLMVGGIAIVVAVIYATFTGITPYQVFNSPTGDQHVLLTQRGFGDGDMSQHIWGPVYQTRAKYRYDFPQSPIWKTAVITWTPDTFTMTYRFGPSSTSSTTATMPLTTRRSSEREPQDSSQ